MKIFQSVWRGFALALVVMMLVQPMSAAVAAEGSGKPAKESGSKSAEKEKPKEKGAEDVTGGRFDGDPIYVHLMPLILPVINESGLEQLVTIILDIQVTDFDAADHLHSNMPRVMDALMRALYGGLGQGTLKNGKLVDVSKVKGKAISAVSEVIERKKIRDVLVQGVAQRML